MPHVALILKAFFHRKVQHYAHFSQLINQNHVIIINGMVWGSKRVSPTYILLCPFSFHHRSTPSCLTPLILDCAGVHMYSMCMHICMQTVYALLSAHLAVEHTGMHASPACLPPQSSPLAPSTQLPHFSPVRRAPPSLTVPPIWLEQRVQAGQPSRSLSKAAEYSSSLGVSPPPLRPGLGPFNKEQVIQMEGGGSDSKGLVGGEDEFFPSSVFWFFVRGLRRQSALVNIFLVFSWSCCFDTVGRRPGQRWLQIVLELVPLICHCLLNTNNVDWTLKSEERTNPFQDISYEWQLNSMLLLLNWNSKHLKFVCMKSRSSFFLET